MSESAQRWHSLEDLYQAALEREPSARAAFLAEACADESLRREVESLLDARRAGDDLLERPAIRYPAQPLEIGAMLGQYRIEQRIGAGGMGAVYRAEDSRLRRRVAIKVLSDPFLLTPSAIDRFWVEARAVSALNHPNICTIHDVGEVNGRPYLVMELLEGSTLKERIRGRPLERRELIEWALQITSGLEAAHEQTIIHRDLKPANIFITRAASGHPEQVKILDFGLAKRIPAAPAGTKESTLTALTQPGSTVGTVNYMSPEQARGAEVDYRSDIFSFGAVLYEMASGQKAFAGSIAEAFAAILDRDPAPVGDAKLDSVIGRALRKNPAERYQSASELKAALEALRQTATPLSRRKLMYGAGTVAVAGAAALATRSIWAPSGPARLHTLAVILIENLTGDPALDWMDRGLCELLTTALAQSQALAVLSTEVVRAAAAHRFRDNGRLTAERAHDVARDTHADLYASGALFKVGPGFRLNLRVQETKSGRLVYADTVEGADAQALFGMADQAAAAMLAQIAPRSQSKPDSAGGLTSNLEALKAYTQAGIYFDQWLLDRAVDETRRAVELDPDFAMAQAAMAGYLWKSGTLPAARAAVARALAMSRRRPLPLAHARRIQNLALFMDGRVEEGLKVLETARKEAPQDPDVCLALAVINSRLGRFSEAIAALAESIRLNPNSALIYLNAAYIYGESGDLPKALEALERHASLAPNNWFAASARGDILSSNEHYDEALEQYRIAEKTKPTVELRRLLVILGRIPEAEAYPEASPLLPCDVRMRKGDLDGALECYERNMRGRADRASWEHWPDTWNAGNLLLEQRDAGKALVLSKRLANPWAPGLCGAAHLILGDEGAAQEDFAELRKGIAPIVGDFMAQTTESVWRIRAASYMGKYGEVADLCSRLTRSRDHARWAYSLDLVRAHLALGRLADAEAELTWLIRLLLDVGGGAYTWQQFSMLTYLLARFHFAQIREGTGRRAEAAEWYRYFLNSFEHSAATLPQIAEARAALKRF